MRYEPHTAIKTEYIYKMKKLIITLLLIAAIIGSAAAQDDETFKWGVNAGIEMNMNSGNHPQMSDLPAIAFGVHAGGEFNLNSMFSAGINLSVSFSDIFAIEATGFFRWYFYKNIFAQADIGLWTGNKGEGIKFLGGASAGLRIPLPGNFYIEPYARFGYPFLVGGGVTTGYLFR